MTLLDITDAERSWLVESVLASIDDGILVLSTDYDIVMANRRMEQRHASKMPLVGEKCYTAVHDRIRPCPECPCVKSLASGEPHKMIMRDSSPDNPAGWFEVSAHLLQGADGQTIGMVEQVRDITERKQVEELLQEEVARRRLMVEQSGDGILVLNQSGGVYEVNQRYAQMLGYTLEEFYQLHIWDWDTQWDRPALLEMIATVDDTGDHLETRQRRKDGTLVDVEISSNGAFYNGEKLVFCVCRDITEKKAMQEQIRQLAIRDPLTEIFNRRYVFQRLKTIAAEYSRGEMSFCISILDLDHFKDVNDTHGHQAGDLALTEFARTVASMIRPYDLFGRYGGEEFIIVSRNAGECEVTAMIDRILEKIRATTFSFGGHQIRLTFSCGIADSSEFPQNAFSIEAMVSLADKRLYQAKAEGRDRVVGLHRRYESALAGMAEISRPTNA